MKRIPKLLGIKSPRPSTALVSFPSPSLWVFAQGYLEAGKTLAWTCIDQGAKSREDKYLYPILFLLRHSIELHLKNYVEMLLEHLQINHILPIVVRKKVIETMREHKLLPICHRLEQLAQLSPVHRKVNFSNLETRLVNWHELDNISDTFRFRNTREGKLHAIFEKQWYADLKNLVSDAVEVCEHVEYAGDDPTIWLYDNRIISHQFVDIIETGKTILKRMFDFLPAELKKYRRESRIITPTAEMIAAYERHRQNEEKQMSEFKCSLNQFSDKDLALALYCYYVGREGPDWTIRDLITRRRDELIQRLWEKAPAFVYSLDRIDKEIARLKKLLLHVEVFYPSVDQIRAP